MILVNNAPVFNAPFPRIDRIQGFKSKAIIKTYKPGLLSVHSARVQARFSLARVRDTFVQA